MSVMSDENGNAVTQREFGRTINTFTEDIKDIKSSMKEISQKVDKNSLHITEARMTYEVVKRLEIKIETISNRVQSIFESEIPRINEKNIKLDSKTKTMWGVMVAGLTIISNVVVHLIKGFFGG